MKHIFIINPVAGKKEIQWQLVRTITDALADSAVDWEIHETTGVGDAMFFARDYPKGEVVRFYAVGGDGTLNEVVNGAVLRGDAEVGIFPCGTGNDFVRVFDKKVPFFDVAKQVAAKATPMDIIKANGNYAINMCNMGIDAQTAADVHRFARYMSGSMAYSVSLVNRLIHPMGYRVKVTLDHKESIEGKFILATFANGVAYGGGYYSAPKAKLDDGEMDVCLIRPVSRMRIATLLASYKKGAYLEDPRFARYIIYRRAKQVQIETEAPQQLCIDGEISNVTHSELSLLPKALPLVIPEK